MKLLRPAGGLSSHLLAGALIAAAALVLLLWRLGTLTAGLSHTEATAAVNSQSLHLLAQNPINAPQRLIQYGLQAFGHHNIFWLRLASVLLAIAFLYCFYTLARWWFGRFIGLLSTLIFMATPMFILLSRSAAPKIMLLYPLVLLVMYQWFRRTGHSNRILPLLIVAAAIGVYSPGGIWLILVGAFLARRRLAAAALPAEAQPTGIGVSVMTASFIAGFLLLVPLVWSIFQRPGIWHDFLLIPSHWMPPLELAKSVGWAAAALVWRAPHHIEILLGTLPVLSVTQIVLCLFGAYALWRRAKRELYGLLVLLAGSIVAAGINGDLYLLALGLPVVGLLGAAGLRYLYGEWRTVFPRNPFPRALAVVLICLLVGMNVLLGGRYSLVAWPHSAPTREAYTAH